MCVYGCIKFVISVYYETALLLEGLNKYEVTVRPEPPLGYVLEMEKS